MKPEEVKKVEDDSNADAAKVEHKEVIEASTAPAMIKEVCKSLNVEHIERERKKMNVVVSNVAEAPIGLSGEQKKEHDINYLADELGMDKKYNNLF